MRAIFTFLALLVFYCMPATSQELHRSLTPDGFLNKAHQEKIFVHHNSALIFPGEYFLYSVYNLNASTGKLSDLSKIAYVELVGENGDVVFRQKVRLENGLGNADYFIPTSVPSGNYKLLAYTNWMRNVDKNFFASDITLINPYQSNQKDLLEETSGSYVEVDLSLKTPTAKPLKNSLLSLNLNKNSFEKRDQVRLTLKSNSTGPLNGSYSLSVRKIESLPNTATKTAATVTSTFRKTAVSNNDILKLPELRGQMVSGRLTSEGTSSAQNQVVSLSIPSEEGFVEIATTNDEGQFFFNLESDIRNDQAVLEVIGSDRNNFKIELDRNEGINPSTLNFSEFKLTPEMQEAILQRSIYNQIENAFFTAKPDTLVPPPNEWSLPPSIVEIYNLDDYTRFKSLPETFVEIIKSAWVRKNASGEAVFQVRGLMGYVDMGLLPLVMIDGILVQDHSIPATMDARRIQTIKVVRDKIFLGPASYQGAVLFETINKNFFEEYTAPYIRKVELFTPEIPKKYFQQVYTDETRNNRIPDYRYQLLWKPNLELETEEEVIEFYTSDVDGQYEIVLEGFTADGKPVSVREQFRVE